MRPAVHYRAVFLSYTWNVLNDNVMICPLCGWMETDITCCYSYQHLLQQEQDILSFNFQKRRLQSFIRVGVISVGTGILCIQVFQGMHMLPSEAGWYRKWHTDRHTKKWSYMSVCLHMWHSKYSVCFKFNNKKTLYISSAC